MSSECIITQGAKRVLNIFIITLSSLIKILLSRFQEGGLFDALISHGLNNITNLLHCERHTIVLFPLEKT